MRAPAILESEHFGTSRDRGFGRTAAVNCHFQPVGRLICRGLFMASAAFDSKGQAQPWRLDLTPAASLSSPLLP
jgi:hypothetical protein